MRPPASSPSPPPDGAPAQQAPPTRVWLADDSAWEAEHTRSLLAGTVDRVEVFSDGASLLERLAQPGVTPPDLLVLDWHMPGVTGLEALRFLRERLSSTQLPVLVLTASTDAQDLEEAFAAGANDFVAKPVRAVELLARVRTLVAVRAQAEALRASQERYRTLFESMDDGYCLLQLHFDAAGEPVDYRFLEANTAFEAHTGLRDVVGRTARELVPDLDPSWFAQYGRVALTGEPARFENDAPAMGRSFEVHAARVGPAALRQVALVFKDVTARRAGEAQRQRMLARESAARAEAEEARQRLAALFEGAPAIICTFRGPDLVYEFSNPLHQQLVGQGRQLVGRPVREAVPEAVEQGVVALLEQVYRTGEPYVGRELLLRLDRRGDGILEEAFVDTVYQPARDAGGRVVGVDVFGFDVTGQVRARQRVEALAARLRESEERLRRVVEATGTGTWEMDVATETLVADAHFRALFGLTPDEPFPLDKGLALIHAEDRPRVAEAVASALAGAAGGRYREEYRTVRTPDGRWRWVEARGQAVFGPDGRPTHILGTGVDVTARKEAEAAREDLLEALSAQSLVGVALFHGPQFVFERANAAYRELVGNRQVEGKPLLVALPEIAGQGFDTLLQGVRDTGTPAILREALARVDRTGTGVPEDSYFDLVFQPMRSSGGACEDILLLAHDVSGSVRLRQEAERLMALEKERAGFEQQLIGMVSHDLRNPISAILMGATVLLRRPDVEERQRRTVERILTSAGRANRMVHDLLDFTQARLGSGLTAVRVPGDLHAVVRQVVEESQVSHPGRSVRLTQSGDGQGAWDADRLAQLVGNLLSNALHYSPADTRVSVETRGEDGHVTLSVHNAGAPIAPDVLPRLFQPMQRGVDAVSEVRSVGLGLYIVEQVVRAHAGTVEVASTAEAGTTFTVRLPRAAP